MLYDMERTLVNWHQISKKLDVKQQVKVLISRATASCKGV